MEWFLYDRNLRHDHITAFVGGFLLSYILVCYYTENK